MVSDDPAVPPIIEHRYDSDPHDVATLSAGAELARELASSSTEVGQATWSTSQHLCGTAPMGAEGDAAAVVDERCRVRGVEGLWVVDGSVLPAVTGRGPHATIVMLGHRAAEFVVTDRRAGQPADDAELSAVAPRRPDCDEAGRDGQRRSIAP